MAIDGCVADWNPHNPIIFYHSENDNCVPFQYAVQARNELNKTDTICFISSPPKNRSHFRTGFKYYSMLLRYDEKEIFKRLQQHQTE